MLYKWSGAAYRSKQIDIVAIEVEETLELIVTHDRDGGVVFSREKIDGIPIHQTEGFDDAGQMQEWFTQVVPIGKTVELSLMRFRLLNVRVVAPPTLESDCIETEKLMGGCSPATCSPSSSSE